MRPLCSTAAALAFLLAAGGTTGCGSGASLNLPQVGCPECTVLTGAKVFDGSVSGPGTVVLRGQRIERLHRGDVEVVAGRVIDLPGRTILPGLINMHVHVRPSAGPTSMADRQDFADDHLKAFLRAGVTTVLDLGTEPHVVFTYRQRIRDGAILGPSLLAAGPGLTPTGGHPCYTGRPSFGLCAFVDEPQDASREVNALAPYEPDAIKVIIESGTESFPLPEVGASSLEAVVGAADAMDVPVFAHVAEVADVSKALDAGVRHFAHLPVHDRIDAPLAQRMKSAGAVVVPTLAVVDARLRVASGTFSEVEGDTAYGYIPSPVVDAWRDPTRYADMATSEARDEARRRLDNAMASLGACHDAGVTIVAGTDAGNPGVFHGLSLHRELALMVEAGLVPEDALRASTLGAATVMGLSDRGRIEAGARADLLIVRGDPTADIAMVSEVDRVFVLGEELQPDSLRVDGGIDVRRKEVTGLADGAPCLGEGECDSGSMCTAYSWCRRACSAGQPCGEGQACFELDQKTGASYCHPGDGCDPVAQDCDNAIACVWLGGGITRCWYPGPGEAGDACASWGMCAPGYQCDASASTCMRLCDPAGENACEEGTSCVDRTQEAGVPVGECR